MATRRLARLAPIVGLLAGACALSLLSRTRSQTGPNDYYWLFLLEPVVVLGGGLLALFALLSRPRRAAGMVAVGLYTLAIGIAFLTLFPIWLPDDDTILGSALVGGLMVGAGVGLAVGAARIVHGRQAANVVGMALGTGAGAFFLAAFGGMVAFPIPARPQYYVAGLAVVYVLWLVRHAWQPVRGPLLLAGSGVALSVGLLIIRGPGDWATSDSTTLKLYSFPILLAGVAICLGILTLSRSGLAEPDASTGQQPDYA